MKPLQYGTKPAGPGLPAPGLVRPDDQAALAIWVIYRHPADFPDHFVVRRQDVLPGGAIRIAPAYQLARTLATARQLLPAGLVCLGRHKDDDPAIAEVWL